MSEFEMLLKNNANAENLSVEIYKIFKQALGNKKLKKSKVDFLETDQGDLYAMLLEKNTYEIIKTLDFLINRGVSVKWASRVKGEINGISKKKS